MSALGDVSDASISATGDVPPKFTQLLKDIEGTEGELVRFECRVIGQPTPTIKWFCGRNQIENTPEFQVQYIAACYCVNSGYSFPAVLLHSSKQRLKHNSV